MKKWKPHNVLHSRTVQCTKRSIRSVHNESFNNLKELAKELSQGKRVLFLTGAGISAASGVPTYRSSPDAVWNKYITEYGTTRMFKKNPLEWYNNYWLTSHGTIITDVQDAAKKAGLTYITQMVGKPSSQIDIHANEGHKALSTIAETCHSKIITQNVDGLHAETMTESIKNNDYLEVHGNANYYRCVDWKAGLDAVSFDHCPYASHDIVTGVKLNVTFDSRDTPQIQEPPACPGCNRSLIPAVLFFNESYTTHSIFQWPKAVKWMTYADVLVFVGTSHSVGVTKVALKIAKRNNIPIYDINIKPSSQPPIKGIEGESSEVLQQLQQMVAAVPLVPRKPIGFLEYWSRYVVMLLVDHVWASNKYYLYIVFGLSALVWIGKQLVSLGGWFL